MVREFEPQDKFTHAPGEILISEKEIHVLAETFLKDGNLLDGYDSADKIEEYLTVCGKEINDSYGWQKPNDMKLRSEFVGSIEDGLAKGAVKCQTCFALPKETQESTDSLVNSILIKLVNEKKSKIAIEGVSSIPSTFDGNYSQYNPYEKGDRCIYHVDSFYDQVPYETKIKYEGFFFKKSDLTNAVKNALNSEGPTKIQGTWIYDDVFWDDSIPTGECFDGPKTADVDILVKFDDLKNNPKLNIEYKYKYSAEKVQKLIEDIQENKEYYNIKFYEKNNIVRWVLKDFDDDSGGNDIHEHDVIDFKMSDLKRLISIALVSRKQSAFAVVPAKETFYYVHYPYNGSNDGDECPEITTDETLELTVRIVAGKLRLKTFLQTKIRKTITAGPST
jgi:hypothetical protein